MVGSSSRGNYLSAEWDVNARGRSGHDETQAVADGYWRFGDGETVSFFFSSLEFDRVMLSLLLLQRQQVLEGLDGVSRRECRPSVSRSCIAHQVGMNGAGHGNRGTQELDHRQVVSCSCGRPKYSEFV